MKEFLDRIITVKVSDPEDFRKRRLLNILLLGTLGTMALNLFLLLDPEMWSSGLASILLSAMTIFFLGIIGIYFINQRSGRSAAFLFLLLLTLVVNLADTPHELANGRSIFVYTFPIVISSLILFSSASFIFAVISSVCMAGLAWSISEIPNPLAIIGFFMLALVSWLTTRSLEQALKELRRINANLDSVVVVKTQELAKALSRELVLAGRNRAILESIADGVIVFDQEGNAIQANPAITNLLDLPYKKTSDISIDMLVQSPNIDAKGRGVLAGLLSNPSRELASHRIEWGHKTLSMSAAQVRDSEGTLIGTVSVFRDFTYEAEVERMKSRFVAMVSHELRTPLNAVLGYAEMLKEAVYGPVNEKQGQASERIMSNTQRLLSMVGELLDQAQMEAGKLRIEDKAFAPAELLENLHGVMEKIVSDMGLKLTSELDPGLPRAISGDPHRLQQILVNLVSNAVKFTEQGEIHVRLFRQDKANWAIEVRDTGRGIPAGEIPHIFDAFHQVDGTSTREHGGFGLGLSIVKQLVNLMNGEIQVSSIQREGTTFTITLPLKENN
jgi:signal transduction histidine kinase